MVKRESLTQAASPGAEVILRTVGLTKRFGAITAVDGLDLEVRRGEVLGFLGPNGAGKSTTVGMILGLIALQIYFQTYLMGALALVRERVQGTMERMFTYPVKKIEILGGYLLGFSLLGIIQAIYVLIFSYFLFNK